MPVLALRAKTLSEVAFMGQKRIEIILGVLILAAVSLVTVHGVKYAQTMKMTKEVVTVVIDAGHGGSSLRENICKVAYWISCV